MKNIKKDDLLDINQSLENNDILIFNTCLSIGIDI